MVLWQRYAAFRVRKIRTSWNRSLTASYFIDYDGSVTENHTIFTHKARSQQIILEEDEKIPSHFSEHSVICESRTIKKSIFFWCRTDKKPISD